jgi:hypothetical protein
MKKSMIAIAFAVASVPMMFAAQANPPANPPASGTKTVAPKAKKHSKKAVKSTKKAVTKTDTASPAK